MMCEYESPLYPARMLTTQIYQGKACRDQFAFALLQMVLGERQAGAKAVFASDGIGRGGGYLCGGDDR